MFYFLKMNALAVLFACLSVPLSIVLAVILSSQRDKYITCIDYYKNLYNYDDVLGSCYLLRQKEDGTVEWGKCFEKGKGIYFVVLPWIYEGEFTVCTPLAYKFPDGSVVKVGITLSVSVDEKEGALKGFKSQELLDTVSKSRFWSVEEYLAAAFKKTAEEAPAVQIAMQSCRHNPCGLVAALQNALETVRFDPQLTNIRSVVATVNANSASFSAEVLVVER